MTFGESPEADEVDDATLIAAIARADLAALGVLYGRHADAVSKAVHRLTNGGSEADDIVHATFLKVPRLVLRFDGRDSARNWLVGIAVRTALHNLRSFRRLTCALARFAEVAPDANHLDPEAHAAGRARLARLERAVAKLSAAKRGVFVRVELEGLTHDEVARDLGIPVGTVRTRLFHAKHELAVAVGNTRRR